MTRRAPKLETLVIAAIAPIISITFGRTTRHLVVSCPFCGKRHNHGWPYGQPAIGHRVAHCTTPFPHGNYLIPAPPTWRTTNR